MRDTPGVHPSARACLLLSSTLGACGVPSGPLPEDPALLFVWDPRDGERTRYELRSASGGPSSPSLVSTPAELHGARAMLGGMVIDADGHGLELFSPETPAGVRAGARLSPEGERFAFVRERVLYIGELGGTPEPRLEGVDYACWSAEGAGLLVARSRAELEQPYALERISASGAAPPEALAELEGSLRALVAMPEGSFWLRRAGSFSSDRDEDLGESLHRLDPASGALSLVHQTSRSRKLLGDPVPSAAAGLVAFISSADNSCRSGELWLAAFDGSEARRVTEASCRYLDPDRGFDPDLFTATADGRFVGMASRHDECSPSLGTHSARCHDEIYTYDPAEDALRRVTDLDLHNGIDPRLVSLPRL